MGKVGKENNSNNYQETFKALETNKQENNIITSKEIKYVKPIYHTGYVFIVENTLIVASSMAKAIELYCIYMEKDEDEVKEVRRLSNGKTSILDISYDAIIEG